ncbi:Mitochondrial division protein 1 [Colletotrichum chlorophyti]|uniref:Mitochondrial division protein 1 n=1 Tax=Colletotrichum chlorophyti TaxID=708187 RepID=A0A1Q8S7S9_9PEZI|nr:Mitochondrial division protein 1 [Colletotrichum chlorophyti]
MAASDNDQYGFHDDAGDDQSVLSTRGIEAFGRKVTTTASHLIAPRPEQGGNNNHHYHGALAEVHKQLRRPTIQRSVFSMAKTTPTDMVRSKLSKTEIQHRALTYLPDELLANIPEGDSSYSLFQGFKASFPDLTEEGRKHRRRVSRGRKLLEDTEQVAGTPQALQNLKKDKASMMHELEMLGVRKNMASGEIRDIDNKIANLHGMRRIILDRLANLEQEETLLEHDLMDVETRLEEAQELVDEAESIAINTPTKTEEDLAGDQDESGFMSQSVYEKLPSTAGTPTSKAKKRVVRRKSMPILHEHFEAGTAIREIRAHQDTITALDFDAPFGTMVTSAMDDSVRVWDLNAGRCIGLLEGHTASVRTLQVDDNFLATGGMDATIRLWDLSKAHYDPHGSQYGRDDDEDDIAFENPDDGPVEPPDGSMRDCHLYTLSSHVDEITALHFRNDTLIWDLRTGSIYDAYAYDNAITSMMFDERRIVSAAGEDVVKVYDKVEGRQWDCGAGIAEAEEGKTPAIVERVRVRDGYLVEGRQDGISEETRDYDDKTHRLILAVQNTSHTSPDTTVPLLPLLDSQIQTTYRRFYNFVYADLPYVWRQLYTDLTLLKFSYLVFTLDSHGNNAADEEKLLDDLTALLDKALILAGGAGRTRGRKTIFKLLTYLDVPSCTSSLPATFPTTRPFTPPVTNRIRAVDMSMAQFQSYLDAAAPEPLILKSLLTAWPALSTRPWSSPHYLLSQTHSGRRLVPVEVGRSYVDEGWTQELIPFRELLSRITHAQEHDERERGGPAGKTYLAQHELFTQLPHLQNDILTPDHCFTSPPPHPLSPSLNKPELDLPLVNAWLGPAGTITPLHTDGYHNLLCQVVGAKYVRLYSPHDSEALCPRADDDGVDMSNTSAFDVGAVEGWDPDTEGRDPIELEEFRGLRHWDCVLEAGDVLYIPIGWWHYVRSLSVSFSVSFWWNGDHHVGTDE